MSFQRILTCKSQGLLHLPGNKDLTVVFGRRGEIALRRYGPSAEKVVGVANRGGWTSIERRAMIFEFDRCE